MSPKNPGAYVPNNNKNEFNIVTYNRKNNTTINHINTRGIVYIFKIIY
jgi:hypothetical protein